MGTQNDRIGKIGEKEFSLMCTRARVVCNKSDEDERGWDYLIQYPETPNPRRPLDLRKAPHAALVQVKATQTSDLSVEVSLSNALRMAEASLPFFVVLAKLAANDELDALFVRHIWREEVTRILRAVRQADSEGDEALHKRTISFTLNKSDATTDPLGTIAERIDSAGAVYIEAKRRIVETAGFEDGHGTANITLQAESAEDFLDLQLGLRDSLEFTRFVSRSTRFGIDSGKAQIDAASGRLFVEPNPRTGVLRLCSSSGEEFFSPAQAMGAALPGDDPSLRKSRIVASCVNLIISGSGKTEAKANLAAGEPVPLATIELFGQLMQWRGTGPVSLTLYSDGRSFDVGSIDLDKDLGVDLGWIEIGKAAGILKKVAATAVVGTIMLSPLEINSARHDIELMTHLVGPGRYRMSFPKQAEFDKPWDSLLSSLSIRVGAWSFGAIAHWPVSEDVEVDGMHQLTFNPSRILAAEVASDRDVGEAITKRRDQLAGRMPNREAVLEIGDFKEFFARRGV